MKKQRLGLTLIELIVVVAILAVLAMIVLPKLDGLQNNANHAAAAASVADTGKYLQTFQTMKKRFPDGWDSLTDGTNLVAAANPSVTTATGSPPYGKGLHTGLVTGTNAKLATFPLTAGEVEALQKVGINTLYNWTAPDAATQRPNDRFLTASTVAAGAVVAVVNSGSANGRKIIDRVYRDNQKPGGVSGNVAGGTTKQLMALGLGPNNEMVGKLMMEAPQYANVDASTVYGRNLVLFEIGGTDKPIFKGVIAADGDLLDDLTTYMSKDF